MFQRILVPLDGSARAEQAFPVAIRIARTTGASLTLLRVVEPPPTQFDEYPVERPENPAEMQENEVTRAKAYLLHVLQSNELEGIGIATEVRTGIVAQQILLCIEEHKDDLVVMCSHGTTGLKRWLLGSVAQKIAHICPVPVFIVREGHALEQRGDEPFQVLVPLDGSAVSESALLPAAQVSAALAAPRSGALHLVQVVEPIAVMGDLTGAMAEVNQETILEVGRYLKKVEQRLHESPFARFNLAVTSETVTGLDVATVLLQLVGDRKGGEDRERGSQMIAMSTHGRHGPEYWLMGSIAERVLGSTTHPMLIVRPQREEVRQEYRQEVVHIAPVAPLV